MERYIIVLFWILILAVILLSVPSKCMRGRAEGMRGVEPFVDYYGYYKKFCPSCGWRSRNSCSKCTNCIFGVTKDGYGRCLAGDSSGPYFANDLLYYEYGDDQTFYPGSNVYPIVKHRNIYPYNRWELNRSLRLPPKSKILA